MEPTSHEKVESHATASRKKNSILEWVKFLAGVLVVYLIVFYCIGITKVIGHSMDPTLKDGSFLFVNKLSTYISEPSYGDVVIVKEDDRNIVKRVIGLAGDSVSIKEGVVHVNGKPIAEGYILGTSNDMEEITVAKGDIFILGDNRTPGESLDSRDPNMGPISDELIEGYAVVSLYPFYTIKE
jgi:signal peptidase I